MPGVKQLPEQHGCGASAAQEQKKPAGHTAPAEVVDPGLQALPGAGVQGAHCASAATPLALLKVPAGHGRQADALEAPGAGL